jgi:hypothetical protein
MAGLLAGRKDQETIVVEGESVTVTLSSLITENESLRTRITQLEADAASTSYDEGVVNQRHLRIAPNELVTSELRGGLRANPFTNIIDASGLAPRGGVDVEVIASNLWPSHINSQEGWQRVRSADKVTASNAVLQAARGLTMRVSGQGLMGGNAGVELILHGHCGDPLQGFAPMFDQPLTVSGRRIVSIGRTDDYHVWEGALWMPDTENLITDFSYGGSHQIRTIAEDRFCVDMLRKDVLRLTLAPGGNPIRVDSGVLPAGYQVLEDTSTILEGGTDWHPTDASKNKMMIHLEWPGSKQVVLNSVMVAHMGRVLGKHASSYYDGGTTPVGSRDWGSTMLGNA